MTFNTAYNRIALRTVLLFITVSASAYLLVKQWYIAFVFVTPLLIYQLIELFINEYYYLKISLPGLP